MEYTVHDASYATVRFGDGYTNNRRAEQSPALTVRGKRYYGFIRMKLLGGRWRVAFSQQKYKWVDGSSQPYYEWVAWSEDNCGSRHALSVHEATPGGSQATDFVDGLFVAEVEKCFRPTDAELTKAAVMEAHDGLTTARKNVEAAKAKLAEACGVELRKLWDFQVACTAADYTDDVEKLYQRFGEEG